MTILKDTAPRPARQLALDIDAHEFVYEIAASKRGPVVAPHLLLHASAGVVEHPADGVNFFVNVRPLPNVPPEDFLDDRIGSVEFNREFAKATLYVPADQIWSLLLTVQAKAVTHLQMFLRPGEDDEDVVSIFTLAGQDDFDLSLQQFPPAGDDD